MHRQPAPGTTTRWWNVATLVVASSLGAASCVLVEPHERKYLSTPEMTPGNELLEDTFHAHIEAARRASTNGHGGGGGGCGCG
jgi:hypothetical protein